MTGNRIRWQPNDHLPMQSVETARGSGVVLLSLSLGLLVLSALGAQRLLARGEMGGAVLLIAFGVVFVMGALWGLHLLWYRKVVWIDNETVTIEIRRIVGGSSRHRRRIGDFGAIVQLDSQIRWRRYSRLVLPDSDPELAVTLAVMPSGSRELGQLHQHFGRLLGFRKDRVDLEVPS